MKKMFTILAGCVLLGAGCTQLVTSPEVVQDTQTQPEVSSTAPEVEIPVDAKTELWIIESVSTNQIVYSPIEWYSGDQALTEAQKDGCEGACAPSGFYWRYKGDDEIPRTWTLDDTSSIKVKLICNREDCQPDDPSLDGLKSMSYEEYLIVDSQCRTTPTDCPYYAIGTGTDFFQITFSDENTILQLAEWYVP